MKKIKVAEIVGNFSSGGVENVVVSYFKHLNKDLYDIDLICDKESSLFYKNEILNNGGHIIIIDSCKKYHNKELKNLLIKNKYDIVHSHLNSLSVFPLRIAKKCGVKIRVAHSHSSWGKGEFVRNVAKGLLRPFSKRYANHYLAVSEYTGEWLFGKRFFKKNGIVIDNPIEFSSFFPSQELRDKIRKLYYIREDNILIGHIGRLVKTKNQKFLIRCFGEAYKKNNLLRLMIVGDGPEANSLHLLARELNIEDSIYFVAPNNEVNSYYNAFDIFLLPSLYEGMPLVGIEAQLTGCPFAVTSHIKSTDCIINNNSKILPLNKDLWIKEMVKKTNRVEPNMIILQKYSADNSVKIIDNLYSKWVKETYE